MVVNFSDQEQTATLHEGPFAGTYRDHLTDQPVTLAAGTELRLGPWQYQVLVADPVTTASP